MNNRSIKETHYKDRTPEMTISNIKEILEDLGIETEEHWVKENEIGTFSLRVVIKGTDNGTNGKGVTREYALASAYAEFVERLQNGMLTFSNKFMEDSFYKSEYFRAADEKMLTARELIEQEGPFLKYYFKARGEESLSAKEKARRFKELNRTDALFHGREDSYVCLPFCDMETGKTVYLPAFLYERLYTSNGMASGNTPEEAIVQGLAELVERHVQKILFTQKPSLPDIPEEYIQQFPEVYSIYKKLKELPGYNVKMKDCSLGGKYPVAGLLVINKNGGTYGLKLGCHPDFGIAMERTLTETTQGCDVETYATRSALDFYNEGTEDWINVYNSFKVGMAQYPFELFLKKGANPFVPVEDVSGWTNRELMQSMMDQITREGYDILIRDVSYLGFNSYHIIIPGFSEVAEPTDEVLEMYYGRSVATYLLFNPEKINAQNCGIIKATLSKFKDSFMQNTIRSLYPEMDEGMSFPYARPGKYDASYQYLEALCDVTLGNLEEAEKELKAILSLKDEDPETKEDMRILLGELYYVSGLNALGNHEKTMEYLRKFFSREVCDIVEDKYQDPNRMIEKQYPGRDRIVESAEPFRRKRDLEKKLFEAQKNSSLDQRDVIEKLNYKPLTVTI